MQLVTKNQKNTLSLAQSEGIPEIVKNAGEQASFRFLEFFTVQIRNPNTRRAYHTVLYISSQKRSGASDHSTKSVI